MKLLKSVYEIIPRLELSIDYRNNHDESIGIYNWSESLPSFSLFYYFNNIHYNNFGNVVEISSYDDDNCFYYYLNR
jgi:hypothetical protein